MTDNPIFASRQGAMMWRELPEVMRLFDNPQHLKLQALDGSHQDVRLPGDLEAYLNGFGHIMDRFEATLAQFYADGFIAPDTMEPASRQIQPWLVPYFADLFGITLYGPDPESRRSELAQAIWVARRRGTRVAVDRAAESILQTATVVVPELDRVLFTPSLNARYISHLEQTGTEHPADAVILHDQQELPVMHSRSLRHAALPLGMRDLRLRQRAQEATYLAPDVEARPVRDPDGTQRTARYLVRARAGVPCFPATHEDRALRTPDSRAAGARLAPVARPDQVTVYVAPPGGVFGQEMRQLDRLPEFADGTMLPVPDDVAGRPYFAPHGGHRAVLTAENSSNGRFRVENLYFAGTLVVRSGVTLDLRNFAVREIELRGSARVILKHGICDKIAAASNAARSYCDLEYVTVCDAAHLSNVNASDSILMDLQIRTEEGPQFRAGCLRYCRVGPGQALPARIARRASSRGDVRFLSFPCLRHPHPSVKGWVTRLPQFGETGYGVLSPQNAPAVRTGAEDGGELGAYHNAHHLARLEAAAARVQEFSPAGHRISARYDLRLAAPLPQAKSS